MLELKIMNLFYFHFFFHFHFFIYFLFFGLRLKVSMILHICHITYNTVTSHGHNDHVSQKNIEGSRTMMLYYMLIVCSIHVSLR